MASLSLAQQTVVALLGAYGPAGSTGGRPTLVQPPEGCGFPDGRLRLRLRRAAHRRLPAAAGIAPGAGAGSLGHPPSNDDQRHHRCGRTPRQRGHRSHRAGPPGSQTQGPPSNQTRAITLQQGPITNQAHRLGRKEKKTLLEDGKTLLEDGKKPKQRPVGLGSLDLLDPRSLRNQERQPLGRKLGEHPDRAGHFINLTERPESQAEAARVARAINQAVAELKQGPHCNHSREIILNGKKGGLRYERRSRRKRYGPWYESWTPG